MGHDFKRMPIKDSRPNLIDYATMLWRYRPVVLGCVVVALLIGILTSSIGAGPLYEATTVLSYRSTDVFGTATGEDVPPAEIENAESNDIATRTNEELGVAEGNQYFSTLDASPSDTSKAIELKSVGHNAAVGEWLGAYAKNYADYRNDRYVAGLQRRLERNRLMKQRVGARLGELRQSSGQNDPRYRAVKSLQTELLAQAEKTKIEIGVAESAVVADDTPQVDQIQAGPAWPLRLFAAALVGLLIGIALALALGTSRPRVRRRSRAEQLLGRPVLADIPRDRTLSADSIVPLSARAGESVRNLRTQLQLFAGNGKSPGAKIVITSPGHREGRSTIASHVASSFASAGHRTLLVKEDIIVSPGPKGRAPVRASGAARSRSSSNGPDVVSLGRTKTRPDGEPSLDQLLANGRKNSKIPYDVVVVDAPPLLSSSDALVLGCEADAVAVVLRASETREDLAEQAMELLGRYGAPVAGAVLNCTSGWGR